MPLLALGTLYHHIWVLEPSGYQRYTDRSPSAQGGGSLDSIFRGVKVTGTLGGVWHGAEVQGTIFPYLGLERPHLGLFWGI